jgi:hypothetical protein
VGAYSEKLACSIDNIDENIYPILPGIGEVTRVDDRSYDCPEIPDLEDISAEWYRTVAHVPTDKIDLVNTYKLVPSEYGDIDIISVQSTFDMAKLIGNFTNSFNPSLGGMLKKYRSAELAKPLFAAVDLERQELGEDGWGEWTVVPRNKVDGYKDHLTLIPSNMSDVEYGGIEIVTSNYDTSGIQKAIVQPVCYEFASNIDTWYPPLLHAEYLTITKLQREQKRQDARRAERGERASGRGGGGRGGGRSQDPAGDSRRERTSGKRGPRTFKDVISDYKKLLLKDNTQLATYKKPLVVWAHDDTVEPEKQYRYRMRVGVFNPTAGKGWFHGPDKDKVDDVILWSTYSDVTEEIRIDPMTYFFPTEVARDKQSVSIQVSRFAMGNWQSHEFDVMPGQLIGHPVEVKEESTTDEDGGFGEDVFKGFGESKAPEIVDYSTGALLVDIVEVSDWFGSSSLRQRKYSDVLYSLDGSNIERLPTKQSNWSKAMQNKFGKIRVAQDVKIKLLTKGYGVSNDSNMGPGNKPGRPGR